MGYDDHFNIVHGVGIRWYCLDLIAVGNNVYVRGNMIELVDDEPGPRAESCICLHYNTHNTFLKCIKVWGGNSVAPRKEKSKAGKTPMYGLQFLLLNQAYLKNDKSHFELVIVLQHHLFPRIE